MPPPNALERAIAWLNPRAALRRHYDRQALTRAYESASPFDSWKPRRKGASADADHLADAGTLRAKARALVQNVPHARAALDSLVANVVGTGIVPKFTGGDAERLLKLFRQWVPVCDADGHNDFYGLQALAYRTMEQDGEVLVRLRQRRVQDGFPVPLQLQLLEIDWLDTARQSGGLNGNAVVNGIEYDGIGRVVAYWLWDQHPGDATLRKLWSRAALQSRRVAADAIIHLYRTERPGQGRGFTRFAPVIARVRDLQLYEDAEIARKNLEARLSVLASGDVAAMANPALPGVGADSANAAATGNLGMLSSGGITQLPPGVNLTVVEPKPAGGHVDYVKYQLHIIAAGLGVPYEAVTGDMKEVNFSSARVRINEYRRQCEQTQWLTLIPTLCTRVVQAFSEAAQLAGSIRSQQHRVEWSTPKWDHVNPQQEVASDIDEISMGLSTISEKLRRRGYDPDTVFAEAQSDFDKLKASGVLEILFFLQKGKAAAEPAPNGNGATP